MRSVPILQSFTNLVRKRCDPSTLVQSGSSPKPLCSLASLMISTAYSERTPFRKIRGSEHSKVSITTYYVRCMLRLMAIQENKRS